MTATLTYHVGDATNPIGSGNKIIAHVCNNVGKWGAGFSGAVSRKWKEPLIAYRTRGCSLGTISLTMVESEIWICNMVAQRGVRSHSNRLPLVYTELRECLRQLRERAWSRSATVHMPRIGCGLAGGKWEEVEPIVREELVNRGVSVVVYDLEAV